MLMNMVVVVVVAGKAQRGGCFLLCRLAARTEASILSKPKATM